ncbi:MAG: hypothetical protein HYR63_29225 [Proteobacteria bacterium]|nr:hypothetical protein [Pseudomonadota bacterium]
MPDHADATLDDLLSDELIQQVLGKAGITPAVFKEQLRQLADRMQQMSGDMTRGYQAMFSDDVLGLMGGLRPVSAPGIQDPGLQGKEAPAETSALAELAGVARR